MSSERVKPHNRLLIVSAATLLQLGLGTMYAWSFFQSILIKDNHWSHTQATIAFSTLIFVFGFGCAWAGFNLNKVGPRRLATLGGVLYSASFLAGALALHLNNPLLFFLGFSVIGGIGSGFAYVTPVSTVAKWFPDKRGPATAVVVMGFGFGAVIMSKLMAPQLLAATSGQLDQVFMWIGVLLGALLIPAALMFHEAPPGYQPGGLPIAVASAVIAQPPTPEKPSLCLSSLQFCVIWSMVFFMGSAGIAVISFQSSLIQEIWAHADPSVPAVVLARYGATLIAVSSVFNALGRLGWATLAGRMGRIGAFRVMMASQMLVFGLMLTIENPWLFGALVCYVLLCFGGLFGTLPTLLLDLFGAERLPVVFGVALTGFSLSGIGGPLMVAAMQDAYPDRALIYAFIIAVVGLGTGLALSFLLINRRFRAGKPPLDDLGLAT